MPHHPQTLRDRTGDRGFTLIELVVVVVILGVLAAVAVPSYLTYQKGARDSAAQSDLRNALAQVEKCRASSGWYPYTLGSGGTNKLDWCDTEGTQNHLNPSTGVTFTYFGNIELKKSTAYVMTATATGGTGAIYCYASTVGGSIRKLAATSAAPTSYVDACPA